MIIDCHGHYTTAPNQLELFRDRQLAGLADANRRPTTTNLGISDDQIRDSLENAQLKFQRERGTDLTIFSPLAAGTWYPLYEKMVELNVPAMIHVSSSCNPCFHATGAHYINGDTTAFMQFITADLFKDFPTVKFIIPHGGGAVPYHWGRYRGLAQDMRRPPLKELLMNNGGRLMSRARPPRSEEQTSELQSQPKNRCRLLL